jgi:LysR family glycine cleavage system transcriptional activator
MRRRFLPSFTALQAFEAAARHGSFTQAASELNLTQGAISRQVRGLELSLGIRLFELIRQRVVLTELGRRYLIDVRRTIDSLEGSSLRVMAMAGGAKVLDLAALPTFCARWLIPRMPQFQAEHPDLIINFASRFAPFDFDEEPFDAAIHFGPPAWPGAVLHHLFDERVAPVCSPAFQARHGLEAEADLVGAPLLQQTTRPAIWAEWYGSLGLPGDQAGHGPRFDQFSMLAEAAAAGLGVALLPQFLIEEELASGRLVRIGRHALQTEHGYYLAVPEIKSAEETVCDFRDWLLQVSRQFQPVPIQAPPIQAPSDGLRDLVA